MKMAACIINSQRSCKPHLQQVEQHVFVTDPRWQLEWILIDETCVFELLRRQHVAWSGLGIYMAVNKCQVGFNRTVHASRNIACKVLVVDFSNFDGCPSLPTRWRGTGTPSFVLKDREQTENSSWYLKVCRCYLVIFLNRTPTLDWCVVQWGSKHKQHKDTCLPKQDWTMFSNVISDSTLNNEHNWKNL